MTKAYRSRGRVVLEVLGTIAAEGPVGVTRLTTVANLTHGRIQEHLGTFEENGLIEAEVARRWRSCAASTAPCRTSASTCDGGFVRNPYPCMDESCGTPEYVPPPWTS
jgi:hypothetical protein